MIKHKITLLLVLAGIVIAMPSIAQKDSAKFGVKLNGFVNSQLMFDTRQTVGGRETMLVLYPANKKADQDGKDINASPSFNQLAMISRLTANIWGPNAFGAKSSAVLEGDFSGQTNNDNNGFRVRHAFIKLNWTKSELLIGQYWHPFDVPEMLPGTLSLNTGAPFHSFSRHIQMRYSHTFHNFKMIAVAASQRDYASDGPLGPKSEYQSDAVIPNMHLQLHYNLNGHLFGLGGDFKMLQPRLVTESNFKTDAKVTSLAAVLFSRLNFKKLDVKLQGSWGQNLSEHTMLGGYLETAIDTSNGQVKYANMETLNAWIDLTTKGLKWKLGLFAGYTKNIGYSDEMATNGKFYGKGSNTIDYVYRVAPRITYTTGQLVFGSELEYTAVAYGTPDVKGEVKHTSAYNNFRVLLSATYIF